MKKVLSSAFLALMLVGAEPASADIWNFCDQGVPEGYGQTTLWYIFGWDQYEEASWDEWQMYVSGTGPIPITPYINADLTINNPSNQQLVFLMENYANPAIWTIDGWGGLYDSEDESIGHWMNDRNCKKTGAF